jgi:hypothetical protein
MVSLAGEKPELRCAPAMEASIRRAHFNLEPGYPGRESEAGSRTQCWLYSGAEQLACQITPPNLSAKTPPILRLHLSCSPKNGELAWCAPNFGRRGFDPTRAGQYNRCCSGSPLAPANSHCLQLGQCWFWVASAVRTLSGCEFLNRRADAGHEDGRIA